MRVREGLQKAFNLGFERWKRVSKERSEEKAFQKPGVSCVKA